MKQNLSIPMTSMLLVLLTSSAFAATVLQPKHAAKPGDFVDANGAPVSGPRAPQAPKKKKIGTVVRPMNGERKAINTNPKTSTANTVSTAVEESSGVGPLTAGDFKFPITLKNTMTMGRKEELETIGGKNYEMFNEVYVGATHDSGWGMDLTAAYDSESNADTSLDTRSLTDASVIIRHPTIYKDDTFSVDGKFRAYLPTTESSSNNGVRQFKYYSFIGVNLPHKFSLTNIFFPKLVIRNNETPTGTKTYFYEAIELAHQTTKTIALSIGQQTQIDNKYGGTSGTTIDIYPFVDFAITKNILFEPKIYLPVYVAGLVNGGPSGVSLDQSQVELFLKLSI